MFSSLCWEGLASSHLSGATTHMLKYKSHGMSQHQLQNTPCPI